MLYNFYNQYREHKRNPNKKCPDELLQRGLKLKKKTAKLKTPKSSPKKRKFQASLSRKINPLKFIEPAVYGSIRANLTIWGLPTLTVLLILIGTLCEIEDIRTYTTVSGMGIGAFLFLISIPLPLFFVERLFLFQIPPFSIPPCVSRSLGGDPLGAHRAITNKLIMAGPRNVL